MSNVLPILLTFLLVAATQVVGECNYCIANPNAAPTLIQGKLDYCCGRNSSSCDLIQPGKPCYVPGDLLATASYVFNTWFVGGSECDFEGAEVRTQADPSHGDCKFKCKQS